jgi:hypothetical protein
MLFHALLQTSLGLATAVCLAPVPAACVPDATPSVIGARVRGVTPKITEMIQNGIRRSRSFRDLINELERSDVIVYLEVTKNLPAGLDGRLMFMTAAGPVRYLHAQLTSRLDFDELIAVAGHELQHALEVANHPEVTDALSLAMLYERIGIRTPIVGRYDTTAARVMGQRVRAELG